MKKLELEVQEVVLANHNLKFIAEIDDVPFGIVWAIQEITDILKSHVARFFKEQKELLDKYGTPILDKDSEKPTGNYKLGKNEEKFKEEFTILSKTHFSNFRF